MQKGKPREQIAAELAARRLLDFTGTLSDFAATAALVSALDLVISVDTAVAHFAGALGRPVWLLNRFNSDWRWQLSRHDSVWYPTLRLFRQKEPGDWDGVVAHLVAALQRWPNAVQSSGKMLHV